MRDEDMKYCEKIGIEGEHGRCYLLTASMISSMLSVPKVFFIASAILSASSLMSIIEPFFSRSPLRCSNIVLFMSFTGESVTSNSMPVSFATSSGMDKWPSGSTLPMNLCVFAVLSMNLIYHIYHLLSKPLRIPWGTPEKSLFLAGHSTLSTRHLTLYTSHSVHSAFSTCKQPLKTWRYMPRFASPLLVQVLRYFTLPIGRQEIKIQKPKGIIFHLLKFLMFFNGLTNTEESLWRSIWLPFGYPTVIWWFQLFGCHT